MLEKEKMILSAKLGEKTHIPYLLHFCPKRAFGGFGARDKLTNKTQNAGRSTSRGTIQDKRNCIRTVDDRDLLKNYRFLCLKHAVFLQARTRQGGAQRP